MLTELNTISISYNFTLFLQFRFFTKLGKYHFCIILNLKLKSPILSVRAGLVFFTCVLDGLLVFFKKFVYDPVVEMRTIGDLSHESSHSVTQKLSGVMSHLNFDIQNLKLQLHPLDVKDTPKK